MNGSWERTRQLHVWLGLASSMAVSAFVVLTLLGVAPFLRDDPDSSTIAYGLSAVSTVTALTALLFFRSKIPPRVLGQTDADVWSMPLTQQSALLVWCLLEGATMTAAVAFALTGDPVPTVLMALWLATYWLQSPSALTKG